MLCLRGFIWICRSRAFCSGGVVVVLRLSDCSLYVKIFTNAKELARRDTLLGTVESIPLLKAWC